MLLVCALYVSNKALTISKQVADSSYTLGYRRINILAAFCNCIYIQCMELFTLLETIHHLIEHWESQSHQNNEAVNLSHDDDKHQDQIKKWISLFAWIRLLLSILFLFFDQSFLNLTAYMEQKINQPTDSNKSPETEIEKVFDDINCLTRWNSQKLNKLSVSLLVMCELIDNVGKLWTYFLCINFGQLENLCTIAFSIVIVAFQMPLFLDLAYILLQKVHPSKLSLIIQ